MTSFDDRRVPDLLVEQLVLGELTPARAAEVRAALERDPDGEQRVAALAASSEAILARYPSVFGVPR